MEPKVDTIVINTKLKKTFKDLEKALSKISFLDLVKSKDYIEASYVESKDIHGKPYNFVLFKFEKNKISIFYTILPNVSPSKRKLDVVRYCINILSVLEDIYDINKKLILQLVDGVLKDLETYASSDYKRLYVLYDKLKSEQMSLLKRNKQLEEKNKLLTKENYELKSKYDAVMLKLRKLEALSDKVLKEKLQEWITSHDGSIDIVEFADTYKVSYKRVEDALNELVSEGYLEPL